MAIVMVLRVGTAEIGNLWEVWVNITEPVSQAVVKVLAGQPNHLVHFVGDSGRVERSFQGPNTLASFAREVIAESKGRSSWSSSFDQMRDRNVRAVARTNAPVGMATVGEQASAPAEPAMGGVWRGGETGPQTRVPLRPRRKCRVDVSGFHEDIRDLLICLAPFKGVVGSRGHGRITRGTKQQPPLAQLALHRLEGSVGLDPGRGVGPPSPCAPGLAVVAPEFWEQFAAAWIVFSPVELRLAIDAAFYPDSTVRSAKRMFHVLPSGVPAEGSNGAVADIPGIRNMRKAMDRLGKSAAATRHFAVASDQPMRTGRYQQGVELAEDSLPTRSVPCRQM